LNTKEQTIECNMKGTITYIVDEESGFPKLIETIQYIASIHLQIDLALTESQFDGASTVVFGKL